MEKVRGLVVVVAALNDEHGRPHPWGLERADAASRAMAQVQHRPGWRIVCNGGFGSFNSTDQSLGANTRRHLVRLGRRRGLFLDETPLNTHTVADAKLLRPVVEGRGVKEMIVVTNRFHLPRVRTIFDAEFPTVKIRYVAAADRFATPEERDRQLAHEARTVPTLKKTIADKGKLTMTTATGEPVILPKVKGPYSTRAYDLACKRADDANRRAAKAASAAGPA